MLPSRDAMFFLIIMFNGLNPLEGGKHFEHIKFVNPKKQQKPPVEGIPFLCEKKATAASFCCSFHGSISN